MDLQELPCDIIIDQEDYSKKGSTPEVQKMKKKRDFKGKSTWVILCDIFPMCQICSLTPTFNF